MFCSGINFVAEFPSFRVADWKILTGCRGEDDGLTLLTPSWHPATAMTTLTPSSPRVTNGFEFAGFHNNTILVLGDKESWSSWPRETGGERVTHDTAEMMLKMMISWRWWSADEVEVPAHLLRPGHAVDHDVGEPVPAPPPLAQAVAVEADAVVPVQGLLRILALQCNNN